MNIQYPPAAAVQPLSPDGQRLRLITQALQCPLHSVVGDAMIRNLAELHPDERAAMEHERPRATCSGSRTWSARRGGGEDQGREDRKKGKWAEWARAEIAALQPDQYRSMVEREVNRPRSAAREGDPPAAAPGCARCPRHDPPDTTRTHRASPAASISSARSRGVAGSSHSRARAGENATGLRSCTSTMPPRASAVMITKPSESCGSSCTWPIEAQRVGCHPAAG